MRDASGDHPEGGSSALHRFAVICAVATLCLIFVGGLVTSTGSALAVPDWPLAFGKLIPKLQGGVRFEYGHRVAAGTVTLLTVALAIAAWRAPARPVVRKLALIAVGLVIFQAILGGVTVLLELPLAIAVAHAATAQAFFCLIVTIAAITNPVFERRYEQAGGVAAGNSTGTLAKITTAVIYAQILVGAVMRHLGAGLAIPDFPLSYGRLIPPLDSPFVIINFAHRCGALVVAALVIWTVTSAYRAAAGDSFIRRPAELLLALLLLQISLGAITVWSGRAVLPTTAHVATGAALLATSLLLTLRQSLEPAVRVAARALPKTAMTRREARA
ncbi:MAG TPA: COX15/CtaA family protein [Candidatus Binataceae bacterium]|nr:COX15/CtaA family protein [Candidatus Binataceae bacterium]